MILSDKQITKLANEDQMISPFVIKSISKGISHGLNSFALASSLEYFKMPRNVTGLVTAKSTYARCGLGVPPTVLEAGWEGVLVCDFSNHTSNSIRLYANAGAAQILFFQGDQPDVSYSDRKGKYQFQQGITLAKSK